MLASTVAAYAQYQMNVFSIDLITAYQISASRFALFIYCTNASGNFSEHSIGKIV